MVRGVDRSHTKLLLFEFSNRNDYPKTIKDRTTIDNSTLKDLSNVIYRKM